MYEYGRGDIYEMFSRFFEMAWYGSRASIVTKQQREKT